MKYIGTFRTQSLGLVEVSITSIGTVWVRAKNLLGTLLVFEKEGLIDAKESERIREKVLEKAFEK